MPGSEEKDNEMAIYATMSSSEQINVFLSKNESEQEIFFDAMTDLLRTDLLNHLSFANEQGDQRIHAFWIKYWKERQGRLREQQEYLREQQRRLLKSEEKLRQTEEKLNIATSKFSNESDGSDDAAVLVLLTL